MAGFRVKRRKESLGDVLYWRAGRIAGSLYRIYFMALPETEEDYEKSRRFYISGDSAAQTIAQLAGGTFLVSLLLSAGFSDAETGVVTSTASLAAVFQLFTMQRINRLKKRKLFVCFCVLQKLLLASCKVEEVMVTAVPYRGSVEAWEGKFIQSHRFIGQIEADEPLARVTIRDCAVIDSADNGSPDTRIGSEELADWTARGLGDIRIQ